MLQMVKNLFGYEDVAFRSQKLFTDLKYQVGQDPIGIEDETAEWFPKFATSESLQHTPIQWNWAVRLVELGIL